MLLFKINSRLCIKHYPAITCSKRSQSVTASTTSNEVANVPAYPPIEDISYLSRYRRARKAVHKDVENVKTVEEKMIKLNMPRYWGFRCLMYEEGKINYNELPQAQYVTRTHLMKDHELPSYYNNLIKTEQVDAIVADLKKSIEDGVAFEISSRKRAHEHPKKFFEDPKNYDDMISEAVCKQVNRIILTHLNGNYPHLLNTQVDFDPRIEAFWHFGGLTLLKETIKGRELARVKDIIDEPSNRPFQYIGTPLLQLRNHLPLCEILPMSDCENPDLEIPACKYDPRAIGHAVKRRHGTTIAGFWPGDSCEFGVMSYHKRGYFFHRPSGLTDELDALSAHAIISNYGWLLSQASNLGEYNYY